MFKKFNILLLIFLLNVSKLKAGDHKDEFACAPEPGEDKGQIDPWISKMVSEEKYYRANIEIVNLAKPEISLIEESYDFKNKIGEFKFQHRFSTSNEPVIEYIKYFQETVYLSSNNTHKCDKCSKTDSKAQDYMLKWLPKEVCNDAQQSYRKILGPSSLLLHLSERLDNIDKNPLHRYQIVEDGAQNFVTNVCVKDKYLLRYYEVYEVYEKDRKANSMRKIQFLEKNDKNEWEIKVQFNYYLIEIRDDIRLNNNLPLGLGCKRDDDEGKDFKNPQISNQQFELDFQFIQNRFTNYPGQDDINHFDPKFSIVGHNKLYFDNSHNLCVNFGQSPVTNGSVKWVHDYSIRTIFDINLNTGFCSKTIEPKGDGFLTVDFEDPLSILKNIPQVLKLNDKNNVYIGTFWTRNIECKVFETIASFKIDDEDQSFVITHYYPASKFVMNSPNKIPIRIDVRQFLSADLDKQKGYYVFLINKFHPNLDFARQEVFDISSCMTNYYEYNWFLIEFTDSSKQIKSLKNAQLALLDSFRKELGISALRLPKILVDFDSTTVYFTTKLLDVPSIGSYFDLQIGQTLKEPHKSYLADHEESCAKSCYSNGDCVAYSFCSTQVCSLLLLTDYGLDDKMKIPKDYIKTTKDASCRLQTRKYKLKRDDLSSRDIRSVMSELQKKVTAGNFILDVKLNEEEKINLKASEIILNVEPGSKKSNYLEEEKDLMRGNTENYDQFFSLFRSNQMFDHDKLVKKKFDLVNMQSHLQLADCELQCLNNLNCHSFSYCDNQNCIITSVFEMEAIDKNIKSSPNCFVSRKNYLANYAVHENRGVKNVAKEKMVLEKTEEQNSETCAKLCSMADYECLSFEYCDGQLKDKPEKSEKICLLHELNLQSEKSQKLEWNFEKSHCNHYTKKHSMDYLEYGMQELKENDLVEYDKLPLEKCAMECDEHESCNSFDYCFEEQDSSDFENTKCRLHSEKYSTNIAKADSPKCSIYSSVKPKIPVKRVPYREQTYSKGLTVLLSFLSLLAGSSIGVLVSFLCIRKFFKDEEEDD